MKSGLDQKKIVLVIEHLAGRSGGAERALVNLAQALSRYGHRVEIITHEINRGSPFYQLDTDILYTNIRPKLTNRSLLRRFLDRFRYKCHRNRHYWPVLSWLQWVSEHGGFETRLNRYLLAIRADIAIAFLPPAIEALGRCGQIPDLKRIASIHNVPKQDFENPSRWDPNPVDIRRRKQSLLSFDAITVLLPEFKEWFSPELQDRVHIIPNSIEPAASYAQPEVSKTVLAVGRLADVKRYDILVCAFAQLAPQYPDWDCKIYGEGPLFRDLQTQINELKLAETIHLNGITDNVSEAYTASAMLVHPAEFEGFGLVIAEALAHGLPVVAFDDCSGANTLVQDGVNGCLVPTTSANRIDEMVAVLKSLMDAPEKRAKLASAAPATIRQYSSSSNLEKWLSVIQDRE